MTKTEQALTLAAKGFKVFPIKPMAKAPPLLADWPGKATTDLDTVSDFWLATPEANIGIHCDGMIVIDVDSRKGGDESINELEKQHGAFPRTFRTSTPSGGHHIFYRSVAPVSNSVSVLGRGIDVRSRNGYVVAPGSQIETGAYAVECDAPLADAPEWLVATCKVVEPKEGSNTPKMSIPDAPDDVAARAGDWLAGQPGAVEGQGGDAATFAVICGLRDMGVSASQAATLLADWNDRCSPPWTFDELTIKVDNAYRYAQNEPGARAALPGDFPAIAAADTPQVSVRPVMASLAEFASKAHTNAGYVVKGFLQRKSYAELFGAPGEGKTFVSLDLAYHVAADQPWMGKKVHAGPVLYLAFEGTGGLVKRAKALRQHYGDADVPLYIAAAAMNMRETSGRKAVGDLLALMPSKPVLIFIDTFARALMGGDENSAQDVGAFNNAVAALIESTGACVCIVHHSGKDKTKGARGSSALLGAIDTEIQVIDGAIISRKQRDVEISDPVGFALKPLVVGVDADGDEETSCVVEAAAVPVAPTGGRLTGNPKRGFDVLCELAPGNQPVSLGAWKTACLDFLPKNPNARFHDIKVALLKKGYIVQDEHGLFTRRME